MLIGILLRLFRLIDSTGLNMREPAKSVGPAYDRGCQFSSAVVLGTPCDDPIDNKARSRSGSYFTSSSHFGPALGGWARL